MSDSPVQTESQPVAAAPASLAKKLGCGVILVVAALFGLMVWAVGDPTEDWAKSEASMMTMVWPDQVTGLKDLREPYRAIVATRLVDAWFVLPDVPRDWNKGRNEKVTQRVRNRTIEVLLDNADAPARRAREKAKAEQARKDAAPKYTMFTPPPVDEHLSKGGEVWARVAPADQSWNGTGYMQYWLLSADRKTFVALVTVTQVDQSKPLSSQSWHSVDLIGEGYTRPVFDDGTAEYTMTPRLTATGATLTMVVTSSNTGPNGTFATHSETATTFAFPTEPNALSALGEERSVSTTYFNGSVQSGPSRKSQREQFHQITKPNPPSEAGKRK
jgi:hypothetical protein